MKGYYISLTPMKVVCMEVISEYKKGDEDILLRDCGEACRANEILVKQEDSGFELKWISLPREMTAHLKEHQEMVAIYKIGEETVFSENGSLRLLEDPVPPLIKTLRKQERLEGITTVSEGVIWKEMDQQWWEERGISNVLMKEYLRGYIKGKFGVSDEQFDILYQDWSKDY